MRRPKMKPQGMYDDNDDQLYCISKSTSLELIYILSTTRRDIVGRERNKKIPKNKIAIEITINYGAADAACAVGDGDLKTRNKKEKCLENGVLFLLLKYSVLVAGSVESGSQQSFSTDKTL